MLKYWSIKKYGSKLLPMLEQRYGKHTYYTASQVRTTVYQKDFDPKYLPLGYILFLESDELNTVMADEFPGLSVTKYKKDMVEFLASKSYQGYLKILQNSR